LTVSEVEKRHEEKEQKVIIKFVSRTVPILSSSCGLSWDLRGHSEFQGPSFLSTLST
jgi:hypothetical protein